MASQTEEIMKYTLKTSAKALIRKRKLALLLAAPLAVFAVPAPAQAPNLTALNKVSAGQWEIRPRIAGAKTEKICIRDAARLLTLRHRGAICDDPFVIENTASIATVSYSCGAKGHGRTTIKAESSGLIQLNTQGIANNSPFSFAAEGRRTGSC